MTSLMNAIITTLAQVKSKRELTEPVAHMHKVIKGYVDDDLNNSIYITL